MREGLRIFLTLLPHLHSSSSVFSPLITTSCLLLASSWYRTLGYSWKRHPLEQKHLKNRLVLVLTLKMANAPDRYVYFSSILIVSHGMTLATSALHTHIRDPKIWTPHYKSKSIFSTGLPITSNASKLDGVALILVVA
jgi:hypothetical protein